MHAIASQSAISRLERDDWLSMFKFFVVIVPLSCARYCRNLNQLNRSPQVSGVIAHFSVVPEPVGDILSPAGSHRQAHCEFRTTSHARQTAVFALEAARSVRSSSLFDPMMP